MVGEEKFFLSPLWWVLLVGVWVAIYESFPFGAPQLHFKRAFCCLLLMEGKPGSWGLGEGEGLFSGWGCAFLSKTQRAPY